MDLDAFLSMKGEATEKVARMRYIDMITYLSPIALLLGATVAEGQDRRDGRAESSHPVEQAGSEDTHGRDARQSIDGEFRVGPTGILCVKEPCPRRGITEIGGDGHPKGRPLWSGGDLPEIIGRPEDRKRIATSWQEHGCLIVRGRLEQGKFEVAEIVATC
jgi:hypothetical protein